MITIQPQSNFTIIWENDDPSDATTYYPQVKIRDAISATLIDTVNLSLVAGSQSLYSANWQAPADVSGSGYQINMSIRTYTDAGHTVLSTTKAVENRDFLVFDRLRNMGGGSSISVDYKKIGSMIDSAITRIPFPKQAKTDLLPLHSSVNSVADIVRGIKIPKQVPTDLGPVLKAVEMARDHIKGTMPKVDMEPMMARMDAVEASVKAIQPLIDRLDSLTSDVTTKPIKDAIAEIRSIFGKDLLDIKGMFEDLTKQLKSIPMVVSGKPVKVNPVETEKTETPKRDARNLLA